MHPTTLDPLFSLHGKTALVTGGSRGLGRLIAAALLRRGAKVYISSRKREACDATARELSDLGACVSLPADVGRDEGIQALANGLAARESRLDVLVHNAGAAWAAPFEEFPRSGWDKVMDLNLRAPFFLTQALHPLLREAGRAGLAKVIHIASIDGTSVNPLETYSYAASKAGLVHLTRRLALRLIGDNIAVSAVAPGAFPSDMNTAARDAPQDTAQGIPAGRLGTAEDIAGAVVYLASRAGDYVVGQTLVVDGGLSLSR
ncbi:SDR family oxidoreductase [Pseudorhodoferax sp. Leaf274]|uniref:SDR family oxidoreductase n=1 Tax=Pseudorhodoferax sp. Leaf274 TaxID=1736318 RepID=UPI0007038E94|nr:SDR family oxidoreductase [Pseudorhodoferax sp. Leaf274]KQP37080.1 3-oxoacyl-ACP reductase [Pseudorhodoferax sp. Leaf274]